MAKVLAALGVLAVVIASWLWLRAPATPAAAPGDGPGPAHSPVAIDDLGPAIGSPPPAPKPAPAPAPAAAKASEHPDWVAFPDGTALPPLNGVAKSPKLTWHKLLPYSKVVGQERDAQGREWYVHENGARSTTYIDARGQAVAELSMPADVKPLVEEHAK